MVHWGRSGGLDVHAGPLQRANRAGHRNQIRKRCSRSFLLVVRPLELLDKEVGYVRRQRSAEAIQKAVEQLTQALQLEAVPEVEEVVERVVPTSRSHLPRGQAGNVVLRPWGLHPLASNVAEPHGIRETVNDLAEIAVCLNMERWDRTLELGDDRGEMRKFLLEALHKTLDIDANDIVGEPPLQELLSPAKATSKCEVCEVIASNL